MSVDPVDALLDETQRLRKIIGKEESKVEILRDCLSECLAELPDAEAWHPHQEIYVLTDPEMADYPVDELDSVEIG